MVNNSIREEEEVMAKPIPEGKEGNGIRALKQKAPEVAKRMGYKRGGLCGASNPAERPIKNTKRPS